jgi:hypothetical protein
VVVDGNLNVNIAQSYCYECGAELPSIRPFVHLGNRLSADVSPSERDGDYRQTPNGSNSRNTTAECVTIRMTVGRQRSRRSC